MRRGPRAAAAFATLALASSPVVANAVPSTVSFVSVSPEPSEPEAPVAVTVAVTAGDAGADGSGSGVLTGSVTVSTTTNSDQCTADLDGGVGTCVLSIASTGEVGISAQYSGDTTYDPSSNSTSHGVLVPPFTIGGPSETAYDAGVVVTFNGLQATGTAEVFVDGVSQQLIVYGSDGGVPSGVTLFFGPSYAAGCHSISAVNDDASAPPLGIFLDPTGITDAASPCKVGIVSGGVAAASMALGSLQPNLSGAIEAVLQQPMAPASAAPECLMLSQFFDVRITGTLGGMIPKPIAGVDLAANVGADAGAALTATFFLSNNTGDGGADASAAVSGPHTLLFFDRTSHTFQAVQPPPTEVAVDGGSRQVVTFNATSYPSVAELVGTMFFLVLTEDLVADAGADAGADGSADGGMSDAGADAESDSATAEAAVEDATVDATVSDSGDGGGVDATAMDAMDAASLGDAGGSAVDSTAADSAAAPSTAMDGALPTESGGGGSAEAGESSASGCGCRVTGPTRSPPLLLTLAGLALLVIRRRRGLPWIAQTALIPPGAGFRE